jgi:hypothetical protein
MFILGLAIKKTALNFYLVFKEAVRARSCRARRYFPIDDVNVDLKLTEDVIASQNIGVTFMLSLQAFYELYLLDIRAAGNTLTVRYGRT